MPVAACPSPGPSPSVVAARSRRQAGVKRPAAGGAIRARSLAWMEFPRRSSVHRQTTTSARQLAGRWHSSTSMTTSARPPAGSDRTPLHRRPPQLGRRQSGSTWRTGGTPHHQRPLWLGHRRCSGRTPRRQHPPQLNRQAELRHPAVLLVVHANADVSSLPGDAKLPSADAVPCHRANASLTPSRWQPEAHEHAGASLVHRRGRVGDATGQSTASKVTYLACTCM